MNISVASYSSIGGREKNEDSILVKNINDSLIAIVCDGVGGHENGEIASQKASKCIAQECGSSYMSPSKFSEAVQKANLEVINSSKGKTTAAVLWIAADDALTANVGDSRLYQFRGGRIAFQSKDHSVVFYSYINGEIAYEDIRKSKIRNRITKALGASDNVKADITPLTIVPKDAFLICSDGFWEYIEEKDMIASLEISQNAQEWLERMRGIADKAAEEGRDNNSAIVIICN